MKTWKGIRCKYCGAFLQIIKGRKRRRPTGPVLGSAMTAIGRLLGPSVNSGVQSRHPLI